MSNTKPPFPRLIGVCGYARSGKDTIAKILVEEHGYERVAFADKLKEFAYQANPIVMLHQGKDTLRLQEYVDGLGWEEAKEHAEVRETLQRFGMAARDAMGQNIWVDAAMRDLDLANKRYVFTDVRFGNESQAIQHPMLSRSGQLWRVNRVGVGPANDHASETIVDSFYPDFVFQNDHDIEHLKALVKVWAQAYQHEPIAPSSIMSKDEWAKKFPGPLLNTSGHEAPQPGPCSHEKLDVTSRPIVHV